MVRKSEEYQVHERPNLLYAFTYFFYWLPAWEKLDRIVYLRQQCERQESRLETSDQLALNN